MKRRFLQISLILSAFAYQVVGAQDFIGALSPNVNEDWTLGWTEFNPQQKEYGAVTNNTVLNGEASGKLELTGTTTLDPSQVYLLKGFVLVKEGAKLIIPAGTIIRGEADLNATVKNYATLIVERGGVIEINGTKEAPVVFTSNKAAGSRTPGDWGGIVICGKAVNNQNTNPGTQLEGFNNVPPTISSTLGMHGGTENNDNSGVVKYCRIEFGGLPFEANREVNSLTMGSLGSATTIDYVQASYGFDDSFEFFGGTVNASHLISFSTTDDDFDMDFGYRGTVQYGIALRNPLWFDPSYSLSSGGSTSEAFEIDNDANGTNAEPKTQPTISNFTVVGPVPLGSTYAAWSPALITIGGVADRDAKQGFRRGARLRRNSAATIKNSIFMGFRNFIMVDGNNTLDNYGVTDEPQNFSDLGQFKSNVIVNTAAAQAPGSSKNQNGLVEVSNATIAGTNPPQNDVANNEARLVKLDTWLRAAENKNMINSVEFTGGTLLIDPQNLTAPNFRPVSLIGVSDVDYNVTLGVYPNPVAQNASLVIADKEESFSLVNSLGVVVKSGVAQKVEMSGVEKGLYVIKIGKKSTKIVVE